MRLEVQKQSQAAACLIKVIVPSTYVDQLYVNAAHHQKEKSHTYGFAKGQTPIEYITQNYHLNLLEHVQELLFKHFVIDYLFYEVRNKKILIVGDPRLIDVYIEPGSDAEFHFLCTVPHQLIIADWKHLPFKAPQRKKYRDLDRQVESFLAEEQLKEKNLKTDKAQVGDWINFNLYFTDNQKKILFNDYASNLWLRIGDEEADIPLQEIFLDKQVGDSFYCANRCLQEYYSDKIETSYIFHITIQTILKNSYFNFEQLKQHFKIKTQQQLHQKLIEVFSYRHDFSQRRSMAQEALALLLSKHHIDIPIPAVLRQQKVILDGLQKNPDYPVYKMQRNFFDQVNQLAEKQIKEQVLVDMIAFGDNIQVSHDDVASYLNLTNRARTKEFLYFESPISKIKGQEVPLTCHGLKQLCMREKALNHVIHHLTRK